AALAITHLERYYLAATVFAAFAGASALFVMIGYLTGINTLDAVTSVRPPPLPSAAALLCIALGVMLRLGAMPTLRRPRPLWQLLSVLGWAIAAPLLLFGAYAGARLADAQINQIREELMGEAQTLSADVDREIIGEFETLEALAASPSLR